jgi:hypothetical protein
MRLLATREPGLAEVGGFGPRRVGVDQLRTAGDDQDRGETRGHHEGAPDTKVPEIEFIELPCNRQGFDANPQREFGCIVFSQGKPLPSSNHAQRMAIVAVVASAKQKRCPA